MQGRKEVAKRSKKSREERKKVVGSKERRKEVSKEGMKEGRKERK